MQLLPMASSPDLISARYAAITKTPGWGALTTTSTTHTRRGGGGGGGSEWNNVEACGLWGVAAGVGWRRLGPRAL